MVAAHRLRPFIMCVLRTSQSPGIPLIRQDLVRALPICGSDGDFTAQRGFPALLHKTCVCECDLNTAECSVEFLQVHLIHCPLYNLISRGWEK